MDITGTLVNYFLHCKRQCYLHGNKINLEDESELVKIGKALHETKETEEIAIDNIKLDKIKKDYVLEIKKSDADFEASKYQLLFYLKVLKEKGIERKGKLEFIEKNKTSKKTYEIILDEENERKLDLLLMDLKKLLVGSKVPEVLNEKKCKKCAYYNFCYI